MERIGGTLALIHRANILPDVDCRIFDALRNKTRISIERTESIRDFNLRKHGESPPAQEQCLVAIVLPTGKTNACFENLVFRNAAMSVADAMLHVPYNLFT
jgi:hypothetical protein